MLNESSQKVEKVSREVAEICNAWLEKALSNLISVGLAFIGGLDKVTSKGPFSPKLHHDNQEG